MRERGGSSYISAGQGELVVAENERRCANVDAEESPGVAEGEPDGGVQRGHVGRHERRICAGLDDEVLESDALSKESNKRLTTHASPAIVVYERIGNFTFMVISGF